MHLGVAARAVHSRSVNRPPLACVTLWPRHRLYRHCTTGLQALSLGPPGSARPARRPPCDWMLVGILEWSMPRRGSASPCPHPPGCTAWTGRAVAEREQRSGSRCAWYPLERRRRHHCMPTRPCLPQGHLQLLAAVQLLAPVQLIAPCCRSVFRHSPDGRQLAHHRQAHKHLAASQRGGTPLHHLHSSSKGRSEGSRSSSENSSKLVARWA